MLERIILNRLLHKIGRLGKGVNEFVKGRRQANCIVNYLVNNKAKYSVFVDIKGAFDKAQGIAILDELACLDAKRRLMKWIEHFLTGKKAKVCFNGAISRTTSMELGTLQGGISRPTQINILMNAIANIELPDLVQQVGYADDAQQAPNLGKLNSPKSLEGNVVNSVSLSQQTRQKHTLITSREKMKNYKLMV
ncbi:uncharacterized protein [Procambarus clarkii]|uniref:uncharacterized protein n=1 Tax=Procambarus clarkii TaxID=6728 RepID=UPI003744824D